MRLLGIDYGRKKIGLATSEGGLAEPWKVVNSKGLEKILQTEKFDKIIIGISEGKMAAESKRFSLSLGKTLNIPVEVFDETLTSQDAQRLSREAGISQKKRHKMEDAYAAAIVLQNYIDNAGT